MAIRIGQLANPNPYLRSLLKILVSGPIPESESVGLGWGPRTYISNKPFCSPCPLRSEVGRAPDLGVSELDSNSGPASASL